MLDKKIRRPHSALLGSPAAWPSWDASSVVLPLCCILSLHHYYVVASSLNQPSCDVKTPARGHKVGDTIRKRETCDVLSIQYKEKTVTIMVQKNSEKETPPKNKTKKQVWASGRMQHIEERSLIYVKVPLYCMHQSSICNFTKRQAASGTTRTII